MPPNAPRRRTGSSSRPWLVLATLVPQLGGGWPPRRRPRRSLRRRRQRGCRPGPWRRSSRLRLAAPIPTAECRGCSAKDRGQAAERRGPTQRGADSIGAGQAGAAQADAAQCRAAQGGHRRAKRGCEEHQGRDGGGGRHQGQRATRRGERAKAACVAGGERGACGGGRGQTQGSRAAGAAAGGCGSRKASRSASRRRVA